MKRHTNKFIIILILLVSLVCSSVIIYLGEKTKYTREREQIRYTAETEAGRIELVLNTFLEKTKTLGLFVIEGNGSVENFNEIAAALYDDPAIKGLCLAPGGTTTQIYPLAGNEAAIGGNVLKKSSRATEAELARDTGVLTLAGPYDLTQGGFGVIGRLPVYLKTKYGLSYFWGFTSIILNMPDALSEVHLESLTHAGYSYRLYHKNPSTGEEQVIVESPGKHAVNPVTVSFTLYNASWNLSVAPLEGWITAKTPVVYSIIGILISLLLAWIGYILLYINQRRSLREKERINEKEQSERKYRDDLFGIIAENINNIVIIYDCATGKIEMVFHNIERILGISGEEFTSELKRTVEKQDAGSSLYDVFECNFSNITEEYNENILWYNEKENRNLWLTVEVIPSILDQSEKCILVVNDITEDKAIEERLTNALTAAEKANKAKSSFLFNMSHEIRTPINGIMGMTEILKKNASNPEQVNYCAVKIDTASEHLLSLVSDILDFTRIESSKLALEHVEFELKEIIKNVIAMILPQSMRMELDFRTELNTIICESFVGDKLRIQQILVNVLTNAIKFTPKGGRVTLTVNQRLSDRGGFLNCDFVISDSGIGMSKDFCDHIFDAFEQESSGPSKKYGGTGLGMTITRNITESMGGRITVNSSKGSGTVVTINLNLEETSSSNAAAFHFTKQKNIILYSDTTEDASYLSSALKSQDVAFALIRNGEQLSKALQSGVDTLILDRDLKCDSWESVIASIESGYTGNQPDIVLISYSWLGLERSSQPMGVTRFADKPLFISDLHQALYPEEEINTGTQEKISPLGLSGMHILLAEDNELNREITVALIEEKGAAIDTAEDGLIAYEKYKSSPAYYYDAIIMDVQMPNWDGNQSTREIRRLQRKDAKDVSIIAMTANVFQEDVETTIKAGMNYFIPKPINMQNVNQILESCYQHSRNIKGLVNQN